MSQDKSNIKISNEWDKIFKLSDKVAHKKVTFHNRFGITLVGDLYEPKVQKGKMAAIAPKRKNGSNSSLWSIWSS